MSTVNMYIPAQRTFATTFEDGLSTGHQCCSSGDCKIARERTEQHKFARLIGQHNSHQLKSHLSSNNRVATSASTAHHRSEGLLKALSNLFTGVHAKGSSECGCLPRIDLTVHS
ncbi:hypothetical protein MRX96_005102 [Rhipicephalus microplus]